MCGIAGIVSFESKSNQISGLKAMCDSMKSRGPDGEGYVFFKEDAKEVYGSLSQVQELPYLPKKSIKDCTNSPSNIALGHRRLSIIDTSALGHQPMCDQSENFWIVFNGEIYNFEEIRHDLIAKGYIFHSDTDTEVVLKAYIEWKEKCLDRLNGMFAFTILDKKENKLFAARDRVGIKPYYYYKDENQFIFGSTIQALLEVEGVPRKVDWEGLAQNFTFSIAQRPYTCFENIVALAPSHYYELDIAKQELTKTQYWEIPFGTQDFSLTESKAKDLLEEAIHQSVRYRLNSDVPIGTFMSGGIDSTLITAIASTYQPNIDAYTIGYAGKYKKYNEIEEAAATAKLHPINHIINTIDANLVLENIGKIVQGYEEPYHHLPSNFSIAKTVANYDTKVVLSGLGGDELFAGYAFYNRVTQWQKLRKASGFISVIPAEIHPKIASAKKWASCKNVGQFYALSQTNFRDNELNNLFKKKCHNIDKLNQLYNADNKKFTDNIEALSYFNLKSYIGNHQTRTIDQFTMMHSLEGRFPLLDHHVIDIAFKIPSLLKIKNGQQKYILRQVAKKYIASESLQMSKKGFTLPLEYWIDNQLKPLVKASIDNLKNRQIFNNKNIEKIMEQGSPTKVWQLTMTELWLQKFID